MSDKKKVVIVDDHPLFRRRLAQLIRCEADIEVVGEAENTTDAIELIRNTLPNLAIVDIGLKGSSGLELINSIRAWSISVHILVLSMHEESLYAERVIRAGAAGYITKNQPADEILLAVRRVLGGELYLSEAMTLRIWNSLTTGPFEHISEAVHILTTRELEVLDLIGHGHKTREIANTLQVALATVDTFRAKIQEKLKLRNAAQLQLVAIRWVGGRMYCPTEVSLGDNISAGEL
jgi:DNA-binding NarL/FixJ family response regulator